MSAPTKSMTLMKAAVEVSKNQDRYQQKTELEIANLLRAATGLEIGRSQINAIFEAAGVKREMPKRKKSDCSAAHKDRAIAKFTLDQSEILRALMADLKEELGLDLKTSRKLLDQYSNRKIIYQIAERPLPLAALEYAAEEEAQE